MNYEQFIDEMLACVRSYALRTEIVEKQEILKNNGAVFVGITVRSKEKKIAPLIYMEDYYRKYEAGAPLETLAMHLLERSRNAPPPPIKNYEEILDFEKMKHRVIYKLINEEENKTLLQKVPNLPMMDFAIVFYLMLSTESLEECSVLIRNEHCSFWGVTISQLYHLAMQNTPKLCPGRFETLVETEEFSLRCPLHILTNEKGVNGAAVLLYPKMPQMIWEKLHSNYFLIPSSVHEFLVIPEGRGVHADGLLNILREVNRTEIAQEEYLSDSIYYFDGDNITKM